MIDKVDVHERKIEEIQEKVEQLANYTETLNLIKSRGDETLSHVQKIFFTIRALREGAPKSLLIFL
jgi:hypothetical protein